jgi:hypothetical protein
MDKIKFCDIASFVLAIALGVVSFNFYTFKKEVKSDIVRIESTMVANQSESILLSAQVDSLQSTSKIFAKSILYLDSCQIHKGQKADRAERRGRFLGGVIKGLFPGM